MINKYLIGGAILFSIIAGIYFKKIQYEKQIAEQKLKINNQEIKIKKQKEDIKVKSFESVQEEKHKQFIKEIKKIKEQNESKEINDSIGTHTINF
jgi:chorismate synthase